MVRVAILSLALGIVLGLSPLSPYARAGTGWGNPPQGLAWPCWLVRLVGEVLGEPSALTPLGCAGP